MKSNKTKKRLGLIAIILIVLVAVVYSLSDFITDLIWFGEVGYISVFLTEIFTKLKIGIPGFIIFAAIGFVVFTALKRSFLKKNEFEFKQEDKKKVRLSILGVSLALSLFVSVILVENLWFEMLNFVNATEFNITDPLFLKDIGFYMFKYDFLNGIASCAITIIIGYFIATIILYIIFVGFARPSEDSDKEKTFDQQTADYYFRKMNLGSEDIKSKLKAVLKIAKSELLSLGVLFFGFVAFKLSLQAYSVLYDDAGLFYGAGFAEINVSLVVYRVLMVLAIVAAIMLIVATKMKKVKLAVIVPALMVVISLLGGVGHSLVQNLVVEPDELNKERNNIANNIKYTRLAYNLDDVSVTEFSPKDNLTKVQVLDNMETFSNIRINDFNPTQQYYKQTQTLRKYYTFNDVDVDRYYVNGEYTQVFLSAREILPTESDDSWLIEHLKYTHGYGLTLSRVDKITSSGQPDVLIKNIPPVSDVPEIQITRPEIYYGESTKSYVIVNTDEAEFDYPTNEGNKTCFYEGEGGIKLNFINRILFALKEHSFKLLVSKNITKDSKIMIYRNVDERIKKIAPFLTYDSDPYVVTVDGKIYWIADGYTVSDKYPYSEPYVKYDRTNYIRNSVKVVVDAYNGDVSFYICDDKDPIVKTLDKIYPALFKPISELPEAFKAHLQYPNALFNIQAKVYERYHMTDADIFYQNEDCWAISKELYGQSEAQMSANYFIMKLPGEETAEFVSQISYSPSGKNNLSGILVARQDGQHYGELIAYTMPKDRLVYGVAQIEAKVNQDADISKEFSLWNNSGSTYSRGNMFVIPVEDSILYVEPVYLYASIESLPEVKRVIVSYNDKIAYESTLAECLDVLFGEGSGDPLNTPYPIISGHEAAKKLKEQGEDVPIVNPPKEDEPETEKSIADKLLELYKNWTDLGKQIEELLKELEKN